MSQEELFLAQRAYLRTGASSPEAARFVRAPRPEEARDAAWVPLAGVPDGPSPRERERAEVEAEIVEAFAVVSRSGIVPLLEAYRADWWRYPNDLEWDDRDKDWREIPDEVLEYFGLRASVFIWGNVASFRYYLPAYMRYELRHRHVEIVVNALDLRNEAETDFLEREEVRVLSKAQRAAVVRYLQYVITFERAGGHAERALERVWLPSLAL